MNSLLRSWLTTNCEVWGALGLILGALVVSAGCLSRSRMNATCEWVGDTSGPLDLQQREAAQHLVVDVELAEELGIRYGDSFRRHYGRLEEHQQASACQARLLAAIAETHTASSADVQAARLRRPAGVDAVTLALFSMPFGLAAYRLAGAVRQRLDAAHPGARFVGYSTGAVGLSGLAVVCFNLLWVPIIEIIRTGNTHRSFRAAPLPWSGHTGTLFVGALLVFTLLTAINLRANGQRNNEA